MQPARVAVTLFWTTKDFKISDHMAQEETYESQSSKRDDDLLTYRRSIEFYEWISGKIHLYTQFSIDSNSCSLQGYQDTSSLSSIFFKVS